MTKKMHHSKLVSWPTRKNPFLETCILLSMPGETKCRTSLDIRKLKDASDKFRGKTTLSPETAA